MNDCIKCIENAERNNDGACICKPGLWDGQFCADWIACDSICDFYDVTVEERTCSGPGRGSCNACVVNAHRNFSGECQCD
jgi:hypothetical protein